MNVPSAFSLMWLRKNQKPRNAEPLSRPIAANADTGTDTHTIELNSGTYRLTIANTAGQENAAFRTAHLGVVQPAVG